MKPHQQKILQTLAERIRETEAQSRPQPRALVPLGVAPLEDLFPERRLPPGSRVEFVSVLEGDGAGTLALWLARQACAEGKALVVADGDGTFYPPGAAALGPDWTSCIVVRPLTLREAYLAAEYSLRCPAVGAVVARCGQLSGAVAHRLRAAAEAGGGIGVILRSRADLAAPAWATLRLLVRPLASPQECRRLQIEVLYCRGNPAGQSFVLEIDHETGHVRLPAVVATPAARPRSAGTSG